MTLLPSMRRNLYISGALMLLLVTSFTVRSQAPAPDRAPNAAKARTNTITDLKVHYKPNAGYTEAARDNRTQGVVKLLVVFRSTGEIGDVTVISALPHGLTDRAVAAAKRISFTPKMLNGKTMDESTTVEYNFRLFYDDDGDDVRTPVQILAVPRAGIAPSELPPALGGKLSVKVFFPGSGTASVYEYPKGLSDGVRAKVDAAVTRIKFDPAIHLNGTKASVVKTIALDL